jgi:hypothetical protein
LANPFINGGFDIWQRSTSVGSFQGYTADRWYKLRGADTLGQTVSRQATGDTTNLPNIQYCARVQRDSTNTSTQAMYFYQSIETVNSIPLAGKAVTLSFYARAGSNYSSASNALTVNLNSGTGTDQKDAWNYTGSSSVVNTTATLTTTWQRFTYTGTVSSSATEVGVVFIYTPVGTAGTNDYYEVTGVQIDIGSVALPFRTYAATFQGELAACQRYYYRIGTSTNAGYGGQGLASSTTVAKVLVQNPVTMRAQPTSMDYSNLVASDLTNYDLAVTSATAAAFGTFASRVDMTVASGLTQYRTTILGFNSGYIGFSAEL